MVKLIALKSHTVDGNKRYHVGDTYEVSEKSARLLIATKLARLDDSKKKREYQRRDMKAED